MTNERPDPDRLLDLVNAEEAREKRGKLKIFFGASAGVGKTYAMLGDARQQLAQGVDVVIGVIETHGRAETEAMAEGLERLPLREIVYHEHRLKEFDLDGALARWPAVILIDELAHTNVAGSRHPKRWQDVCELLSAGINVHTTVNVQHLETLNDIVNGITGIRVWETVPDRIFDDADEVVVVDFPPDELLERLRQGKVYLPQQADQAAKNFFRKGNLLALRELALRRTANRVDGEMQAYRSRNSQLPVWPNRESLLACVGPGASDESGEKIVRACARLAARLDVAWHAVHVDSAGAASGERARQDVLRVLKLAQELGATTAMLSAPGIATALIHYAREHNLSRLVMGRPGRRWRWPGQGTLGERIEAQVDDLDVLRLALPRTASAGPAKRPAPPPVKVKWQGYAAALAACAMTALAATPLLDVLELTNIVMLFLLCVIGIALRYGRGPAICASFVGVALFDFFFVPPRFSFNVSDAQYLLTFAVMLLVALVVGQLTAGLKIQVKAVTEREQRVSGLYEMSRDLSAALLVEQVAQIGARFLVAEFGVNTALLVADENDQLKVLPEATTEVDLGVAQWAFARGEAAGRGTDTLPASHCLVLPLKATMRLRGVLAVDLAQTGLLSPEQRRVLDTCASLMAISIERIHYIDVAQKTTLQMESERLRNSLLSTISHDLRTPLASLVGLADTVQLTKPPLSEEQRELILSMRSSAMRMTALVNNLLDMARLESGAVHLNRQWQPLEDVVGSAIGASVGLLEDRPLKVNLAPDLPLLQFDAVLIERVLCNLLENAAKYTPAHTPISIEAHAETDFVTLSVDDQGPGLPSGREDAIFEKFERGRKEGSASGVGLGLAICRAIMQAHGGSIRGQTRAAGGASFVLSLPRGEPPTNDGATSPIVETDTEANDRV